MALLYLVRHGETTFNAEGRIQGHLDAPLTKLGVRQAEMIAHRLSGETFTAVYSSDLARARTTAEIIAAPHGLPVQTTPLLREANLGVVQGLTRDEIAERFPEALHIWRREPASRRPPGAESLEEVVARCAEFLEIIAREHGSDENIFVAGHGGSLRGLVIAALGLPVSTYRLLHFYNAGLSILETGPNPGIRLLNDTCHLGPISGEENGAEETVS